MNNTILRYIPEGLYSTYHRNTWICMFTAALFKVARNGSHLDRHQQINGKDGILYKEGLLDIGSKITIISGKLKSYCDPVLIEFKLRSIERWILEYMLWLFFTFWNA